MVMSLCKRKKPESSGTEKERDNQQQHRTDHEAQQHRLRHRTGGITAIHEQQTPRDPEKQHGNQHAGEQRTEPLRFRIERREFKRRQLSAGHGDEFRNRITDTAISLCENKGASVRKNRRLCSKKTDTGFRRLKDVVQKRHQGSMPPRRKQSLRPRQSPPARKKGFSAGGRTGVSEERFSLLDMSFHNAVALQCICIVLKK